MRPLFLLFVSALLFVCTSDSFAQCTGDITLTTQAEVDAFPNDYGCSVIEGSLVIGYPGEEINNLSGLEGITSIEGNLFIQSNYFLSSLDGLQNLTQIGGGVQITVNTLLTNLEGLHNLTQIGGELLIRFNDALINLEGLQSLTQIGGRCVIHRNESLTTLDGLQNLTQIGGGFVSILDNSRGLYIDENNALINLDGLQNLTQIGGGLHINDNNALINLDGLQNLTQIEGGLTGSHIDDNDALINLDGLQNLTQIGGNFWIYDNDSLSICCSIFSLTEIIEGNFYFNGNLPSCNSIEEIQIYCKPETFQVIAFFDENENGILDSEEQSIHQAFKLEPNELFSFSDQTGISHLYLENFGEYQLSLLNNNPLWEFIGTNDTIKISYLDSTFSDTLHYFPMIPTGNFTIQNVDLSSSITRCNQETNYWLTYTNTGTTINDGYVELIASELSNFVSADPPADSTAGNKLYWFYEDLFPTHSKQIHLVYEMPSVDEIGEQIAFEANITTNEGLGDHKATLSSELICAYDPNDKLVTPFGYGVENCTLFGDTLEYTVRFQNTGNDTAFTVRIEDQLSEYLDLDSFRPIASSHNVETLIDRGTRLATFTFNDIYLPDSNVNEVGSHGFVKYQILGNEDLAENTEIKNTASIFFDLNPPIITNTVSNKLVSVLPTLAILTASNESLNFGEIAIDESAYLPQILVISNPGDLDLIIENIQIEGTQFSVEVQELIVEGQGSIEVPVYFTPSAEGTYQSELLLQSNVGELSIDLSGTALVNTGITSLESESLRLYPNPNEGLFYIESDEQKILSYKVVNSLGETLVEGKPNAQLAPINLSKGSKGVYFVVLQMAEGTLVEKVLVH